MKQSLSFLRVLDYPLQRAGMLVDLMITGLNHITLAARDIDASFRFYKDVLGFEPICKWEGSAYFVVGNVTDPNALWFCLDYDRKQLRVPSPCSTHYAFSVSADDFEKISARIIESGDTLFKTNTSTGKSLYFLDPDGHKLEIHVGDWRTRVAAKKENPGSWKNVEWFVWSFPLYFVFPVIIYVL